jgi:hypothetical protein
VNEWHEAEPKSNTSKKWQQGPVIVIVSTVEGGTRAKIQLLTPAADTWTWSSVSRGDLGTWWPHHSSMLIQGQLFTCSQQSPVLGQLLVMQTGFFLLTNSFLLPDVITLKFQAEEKALGESACVCGQPALLAWCPLCTVYVPQRVPGVQLLPLFYCGMLCEAGESLRGSHGADFCPHVCSLCLLPGDNSCPTFPKPLRPKWVKISGL